MASEPAPVATGWTVDHLKSIEDAIASGASTVRYQTEQGEREVRYQSLEALLTLWRTLRVELGQAQRGSGDIYGHFRKGLEQGGAPDRDTFDLNLVPGQAWQDPRFG